MILARGITYTGSGVLRRKATPQASLAIRGSIAIMVSESRA